MNFKIIQSPQRLADYVRFFWFSEYNAPKEPSFIHHAFAHHCPEVLFCYKGQFKYKSAFDTGKSLITGVYGQTQSISRVTSNTDFGILGFYLYPHALTQLFQMQANELTNQSVDIKTLYGKEGEILEEKIMLAVNNNQRVKIITDFLEARLINVRTKFSGTCSSIKTISNAYQAVSASSLTKNNFLSLRQFERRFKEFSGFSPKRFLRIARFNSLLNTPFQHKNFADIAFEFGYYDEVHFSHDFKQFSGILFLKFRGQRRAFYF
ncbi:AraC family transcriptional regulator [Sinomicrobium pectinilyticum]|uniref:AraC family transcriptional regulator n=1 Tax=Sinomicrobium pectinilyticum TaxID=1084421 RepID=A0A3N0DPH4_SINP1|nr:helix-turn-helix domain-containing protein [Sinomicrobium pectinilyticum]RNL77391.1 AraC family transcriptional regulator [Sinomicrobium pectinilyticum]